MTGQLPRYLRRVIRRRARLGKGTEAELTAEAKEILENPSKRLRLGDQAMKERPQIYIDQVTKSGK